MGGTRETQAEGTWRNRAQGCQVLTEEGGKEHASRLAGTLNVWEEMWAEDIVEVGENVEWL